MARPRKVAVSSSPSSSGLESWAESLGEALGRGVARGINAGLGASIPNGRGLHAAPPEVGGPAPASLVAASAPAAGARHRDRPIRAKAAGGAVPADRRCKVEGCTGESRSKGLCSKHYQAERRRILAKAKLA